MDFLKWFESCLCKLGWIAYQSNPFKIFDSSNAHLCSYAKCLNAIIFWCGQGVNMGFWWGCKNCIFVLFSNLISKIKIHFNKLTEQNFHLLRLLQSLRRKGTWTGSCSPISSRDGNVSGMNRIDDYLYVLRPCLEMECDEKVCPYNQVNNLKTTNAANVDREGKKNTSPCNK